MNTNRIVRILLPIVVLLAVAYFFTSGNSKMMHMGDTEKTIPYSQLLDEISSDNVLNGDFDKDTFTGHLTKGNQAFNTYLGGDNPQQRQYLADQLHTHGVKHFGYAKPAISDAMSAILSMIVLPLGILFFFYIFFPAPGAERRQPGDVLWPISCQTAQ